MRVARGVLVSSLLVLAVACGGAPSGTEGRGTTSGSPGSAAGSPAASRDLLAPLEVDDAAPPSGYRRDEWPLWKDIDGDGCDARQQALRDASLDPPIVVSGCKVRGGRWVSAYDGMGTPRPGDLDVDHVVPLANAYRSGGDEWSTDQRAQFANDQFDLWVVSAASNRAKGDKGPDEWRPPLREAWCEYARRWVAIKLRWHLRATTTERDALGQMLDTCPA